MGDVSAKILALLSTPADVASWTALLAADAVYENLAETLEGRDAVVERLQAMSQFATLDWVRMEHPRLVLKGAPKPGEGGRTFVLTFHEGGGLVTRIGQQFFGVPKFPATRLVMDAALRERIDTALPGKHPMYITYVDAQGRPQMSQRGSIMALGPDSLGLWARAGSGLAVAVRANPQVALVYRDEIARSTYTFAGRARVAEDEATRSAIFEAMAVPEQRHDFARLGSALVIELDSVAGQAGYSATGPIEPVRLVRGA